MAAAAEGQRSVTSDRPGDSPADTAAVAVLSENDAAEIAAIDELPATATPRTDRDANVARIDGICVVLADYLLATAAPAIQPRRPRPDRCTRRSGGAG